MAKISTDLAFLFPHQLSQSFCLLNNSSLLSFNETPCSPSLECLCLAKCGWFGTVILEDSSVPACFTRRVLIQTSGQSAQSPVISSFIEAHCKCLLISDLQKIGALPVSWMLEKLGNWKREQGITTLPFQKYFIGIHVHHERNSLCRRQPCRFCGGRDYICLCTMTYTQVPIVSDMQGYSKIVVEKFQSLFMVHKEKKSCLEKANDLK